MNIHNKKRVAFLIFSLKAGGAERNIINLYKYLPKNKYDVDIITIKNINDYSDEYSSLKLTIIHLLESSKKISFLQAPIAVLNIFLRFFRLIIKTHYNVLIGGAEYAPFYLVIFFAKLLHKKSILIVGNNIIAENSSRPLLLNILNTILFYMCFKFADVIIFVSQGLANNIGNCFHISKDKIKTIYNGLDIKSIQELSDASPDTSRVKDYRIVSMGRMASKKGFDHLIQSMTEIKKILPNIHLTLIGKGEEEKNLINLIIENKLQDTIKMIGFVKNNPYKLLKSAHAFVFSSHYEGFGNVLIEAMAFGLPVISTDCPYGPREILDSKKSIYPKKSLSKPFYAPYGVLCPTFSQSTKASERLFAQVIVDILINNTKRKHYQLKSLKRSQEFTIQKMAHEYDQVISEILKKENE